MNNNFNTYNPNRPHAIGALGIQSNRVTLLVVRHFGSIDLAVVFVVVGGWRQITS